ncbi:carbohydrate ABC transporter permease [Nocardioides antri]|nr:carbohydrate ABC transporter permease [Nocardioides antri]
MTQAAPTVDVDPMGGEGQKPPRAQRFTLGSVVVRATVALLCLLWLVPTIGLLVSSFRSEEAVKEDGWWTVFASPLEFSQWTLDSYDSVIFDQGMGSAFLNSIVVTVPATIIPIMIAAFAAYAFTFMRFPGRDLLFILVVGLLVVPLQVAFVPLLRLFSQYELNGTFLAVWLAHAGFGMPLAIYILRNYMASLPHEIIESAAVDGASHFRTFWSLVVPMSVPALAAYAIFQFLWVWNDLLVALLFLGAGENEVVTINLRDLIGDLGQEWHLLTAGAFISMVLPLAVFFALQRYFVRGLTAGSVKG